MAWCIQNSEGQELAWGLRMPLHASPTPRVGDYLEYRGPLDHEDHIYKVVRVVRQLSCEHERSFRDEVYIEEVTP